MASEKAFPSKQRETGRDVPLQDHVTASPVGETKWAKDVKVTQFGFEVSTDIIASSTATTLEITSHGASIGDHVEFTSGALSTLEVVVIKVIDANNLELDRTLTTLPSAADAVRILRPRTPTVDSTGALSLALPAGIATEAKQDTQIAAQATLLTELQLKADLSETQPVSAATLPLPTGASTEATLAALAAEDFATQATSAAILAELALKADLTETQPVSVATLPLPTGSATEAKQDDAITQLTSIAGEDFATQATLAALLTELQAKADLIETQPVSAAALPLPMGAATETTLAALAAEDFATQTTTAALLTELALKADLTETQPVSAATLPLPSGAATEAKQDSVIAALGGVDVLEFARHDYGATPVTTAAYTQLVASTSADFTEIQVFDSSGQTLFLAIGAAASEVDKLYIFPGGNGSLKAAIPSGSRVSIKAVSATADAGEISINFLG